MPIVSVVCAFSCYFSLACSVFAQLYNLYFERPVIAGGHNSREALSDVHQLDLDTLLWNKPQAMLNLCVVT